MGKSIPPAPKNIVMKFGGTSLGSLTAFENTVQIVKDAHDSGSKIIVVLSAINGISDLLLRSVSDASAGRQDFINQVSVELRARHFEIAEELVLRAGRLDQVKQEMFDLINDFSNLCQAIRILGEATPRAKDALVSFAEELASRDIDRIWASDEIAIITAEGMGMRNTPGIAGRIFSAKGSEKINVMAIAQGSSGSP